MNFTKKYDNNDFKNIKEIEVSNKDFENSIKACSKEFLKSTKLAIKRIKSYQKKLLPKNLLYKDKNRSKTRLFMENQFNSCGLYIPGGKAIYPSSVF